MVNCIRLTLSLRSPLQGPPKGRQWALSSCRLSWGSLSPFDGVVARRALGILGQIQFIFIMVTTVLQSFTLASSELLTIAIGPALNHLHLTLPSQWHWHPALFTSSLYRLSLSPIFSLKKFFFNLLAAPGVICNTRDPQPSLWHAESLVSAWELLVVAHGI